MKTIKINPAALKAARAAKKMTQEKLGEKIGTSGAYIAQIETGRTYVSPERLVEIAKALDIPAGVLIDSLAEEDPNKPSNKTSKAG